MNGTSIGAARTTHACSLERKSSPACAGMPQPFSNKVINKIGNRALEPRKVHPLRKVDRQRCMPCFLLKLVRWSRKNGQTARHLDTGTEDLIQRTSPMVAMCTPLSRPLRSSPPRLLLMRVSQVAESAQSLLLTIVVNRRSQPGKSCRVSRHGRRAADASGSRSPLRSALRAETRRTALERSTPVPGVSIAFVHARNSRRWAAATLCERPH